MNRRPQEIGNNHETNLDMTEKVKCMSCCDNIQ